MVPIARPMLSITLYRPIAEPRNVAFVVSPTKASIEGTKAEVSRAAGPIIAMYVPKLGYAGFVLGDKAKDSVGRRISIPMAPITTVFSRPILSEIRPKITAPIPTPAAAPKRSRPELLVEKPASLSAFGMKNAMPNNVVRANHIGRSDFTFQLKFLMKLSERGPC